MFGPVNSILRYRPADMRMLFIEAAHLFIAKAGVIHDVTVFGFDHIGVPDLVRIPAPLGTRHQYRLGMHAPWPCWRWRNRKSYTTGKILPTFPDPEKKKPLTVVGNDDAVRSNRLIRIRRVLYCQKRIITRTSPVQPVFRGGITDRNIGRPLRKPRIEHVEFAFTIDNRTGFHKLGIPCHCRTNIKNRVGRVHADFGGHYSRQQGDRRNQDKAQATGYKRQSAW